MAITNLTNTKWQFNETLDHYNIGDLHMYQYSPDYVVACRENKFNINFIYADEQYTSLSYKFYLDSSMTSKVSANSTQIWAGSSWSNVDENDHIITIIDGDDVADPDLIAWLEANATQLDVDNPADPDPGDDGGDGEPPIVDLTNTRWYLNDTLAPMGEYQAPDVGDAGYFTYYQINFTSNDIEFKQLGCVICEDSAWGVEEEKGELQYFYVTMPESDPYEYPYDYLNYSLPQM